MPPLVAVCVALLEYLLKTQKKIQRLSNSRFDWALLIVVNFLSYLYVTILLLDFYLQICLRSIQIKIG